MADQFSLENIDPNYITKLQRSHLRLLEKYGDVNDRNIIEALNELRTRNGKPLSENYKASIFNTLRKLNRVHGKPSALGIHRFRSPQKSYTSEGLINIISYAYTYNASENDASNLTPWVVKAILLVTATYLSIQDIFALEEDALTNIVQGGAAAEASGDENMVSFYKSLIRRHEGLWRLKIANQNYIRNTEPGKPAAIRFKPSIVNVRLKNLYSNLNPTLEVPKHLGLQSVRNYNKDAIYKHDPPQFLNIQYVVKPVTTWNTPTFPVEQFSALVRANICIKNYFLCLVHGAILKPVSSKCCRPLAEFPYTFLIESKYSVAAFPPGTLMAIITMSYLRNFIIKALDHLEGTPPCPQETDEANFYYSREYENYSKNFITRDLKDGNIKMLLSGKGSYIRKRVLGKPELGARMTLTIDCMLSPQMASVPRAVYEKLNLASPLVIISRSPSINSRCIYVCELTVHEGDDTIHINAFVLDGLHADQDGDELTLHFFEYSKQFPTIDQAQAIAELRRLSWNDGLRRDVFYRPRYEFSQHHKLICHQHSALLEQLSPLWASFPAYVSSKQRLIEIMHLGCSIMYDEVDNFIKLVIELCAKLPIQSISVRDMIGKGPALKAIAESGAKGSEAHVNIFHDTLHSVKNSEFMGNAVDQFNNIIRSSMSMSEGGARMFIMLYAFTSVTLHQGNIYMDDRIMLYNVMSSDFGSMLSYNTTAVRWVFNQLFKLRRTH